MSESNANKEKTHPIMSCPNFNLWTTENFFTPNGKLISRDLYQTTIRLGKGVGRNFVEAFRQAASSDLPFYLEFFSPAGLTMSAEIRRVDIPETQEEIFDNLHLLVYLTPDQALAFSPTDESAEFGY